MTSGPSIVIVNQHTNNFGDDAAGRALIEGLAALNPSKIDVFYIWHANSKTLPKYLAIQANHAPDVTSGISDTRRHLAWQVFRRFARLAPSREVDLLLEKTRSAEAVLVSPAGSNLGIYKDWMYLFVLLILVLDGTRPIFVQNTVGPSNSRLFNALARYVLKRSLVFVREQRSQEYLASKGITSVLGVDTAFLLPEAHNFTTNEEKYVAVVPTQLSNWHRDFQADKRASYLDEIITGIARFSNEQGIPVKILPHLYGRHSEEPFLLRFHSGLTEAGCNSEIASIESLGDYRGVIARSLAVVSMRYHGLVLAGLEKVPCISLAYENKMSEAASYLGLLPLALSVNVASSDGITRALEDAVTNRDHWRKILDGRVPTLRRIASLPLLPIFADVLRESHESEEVPS
ncbi:polysaccharide pyruvyl transferase family protein [Microbacterium sp. bgisy207]|jgi:polysaccharide pyruvyl transferase WcaK-like protein|uniref:polysaccharide pyruvyl transferase family protein n=1 Tax=Microbacterium sp. bgisy207 TaxID=3413800 RepID=UPI003EB84704